MADKGIPACAHDRQRWIAHNEMMCCGLKPGAPDFTWFGAIFEDDNIYHVEVNDSQIGPFVTFSIGTLPVDRWPFITRERAERHAARLVGAVYHA